MLNINKNFCLLGRGDKKPLVRYLSKMSAKIRCRKYLRFVDVFYEITT